MLHCNVQGAASGYDDYSPCTLDDLRDIGLDYWALGHVHTQHGPLGPTRALTSPGWSTPATSRPVAPSRANEGRKGRCVVHVSSGRVENVEPVACDVVRFDLVELDIGEIADLAELRARLVAPRGTGSPPRTGARWCSADSSWAGASCTLTSGARGHWRTCSTALRDDFAEDQPFCWWDSIDDRSRPAIDLDAARAGSDFAADLIALADELGLQPGDRRRRRGRARGRALRGAPRTAADPTRPRTTAEVTGLPPAELVDRALVLALGELEGDRR